VVSLLAALAPSDVDEVKSRGAVVPAALVAEYDLGGTDG